MSQRILIAAVVAAASLTTSSADAHEGFFRKRISYQSKQDLFYNLYEGPEPSGVTAEAYIPPPPMPE